jgi:hypothetical protein
MKPRESEAHEDDAACQRAWDNRLDVRPLIEDGLQRQSEKPKKKITNHQSRVLCAVANVHHRTLSRWGENRARAGTSKRIEDACIYLGWTHLLDVPLEDPDSAPDLGE